MQGGRGKRVALRRLAIVVLFITAGQAIEARELSGRWAPGARHYDALETARECGIYRSVASQAGEEVERYRKTLANVKALLQERRAELEKCAEANGLADAETEADDERLAEVCQGAYQAWLAPGYRMMMVEEDLSSTSASLQQLQYVMQDRCGEQRRRIGRTSAGGPLVPPVVPPTEGAASFRRTAVVETQALAKAPAVVKPVRIGGGAMRLDRRRRALFPTD